MALQRKGSRLKMDFIHYFPWSSTLSAAAVQWERNSDIDLLENWASSIHTQMSTIYRDPRRPDTDAVRRNLLAFVIHIFGIFAPAQVL